jgi:hypothetical protein
MKAIPVFALAVVAFCAPAAWAQEKTIVIERVDLNGPNGLVHGRLQMVGDRLTFIDSDHPGTTIVLPRGDVSNARWSDGHMNITVSKPYHATWGDEKEMVLVIPDDSSRNEFVTWLGRPIEGMTGEASRTTTTVVTTGPSSTTVDELRFENIKNGDQMGTLILGNDAVRFESLSDARHSRRWAYSEIRRLEKDHNEVKIEPYNGSKYEFQLKDPSVRDNLYSVLSERIVTSKEGKR